jgi:hypothetical protein
MVLINISTGVIEELKCYGMADNEERRELPCVVCALGTAGDYLFITLSD